MTFFFFFFPFSFCDLETDSQRVRVSLRRKPNMIWMPFLCNSFKIC